MINIKSKIEKYEQQKQQIDYDEKVKRTIERLENKYEKEYQKFIETQQRQISYKQKEFQATDVDLNQLKEPEKSWHPYKYKGKLDPSKWKQKKLELKNIDKAILVHIELRNGFATSKIVVEKEGGFIYNNQFYIFDNVSKSYNIDAKLYQYWYHEDYVLPIKRTITKDTEQLEPEKGETPEEKIKREKINENRTAIQNICLPPEQRIPVNDIRQLLEESEICKVDYASHPTILERFTNSKFIELVMRGVELDAMFKFLKIMLIIILVGIAILIMLGIYQSGVFQQAASPTP